LRERATDPVGYRLQPIDDLEVAFDLSRSEQTRVRTHAVLPSAPVVVTEHGLARDGAGQQSIAERAVSEDPDPVRFAIGK
jgi:hypothetical protein